MIYKGKLLAGVPTYSFINQDIFFILAHHFHFLGVISLLVMILHAVL